MQTAAAMVTCDCKQIVNRETLGRNTFQSKLYSNNARQWVGGEVLYNYATIKKH